MLPRYSGDASLMALVAEIERRYVLIERLLRELLAVSDTIKDMRAAFIAHRAALDRHLDDEVQRLAAAALAVPKQDADAAADRVLSTLSYLVPVYCGIALAAGIILIVTVVRPLKALREGTHAVAEGRLDEPVRYVGSDEFSALAQDFNHMLARLRETTVSRDRLEQSEEALREALTNLWSETEARTRIQAEELRLREELLRNERMSEMGRLVAGVAHEVRNPLFALSATMEASLASGPDRGRGLAMFVDALRSEVSRLGKLMSDLLEYGKPSSVSLVVENTIVFVRHAIRDCALLATAGRVSVRLHGADRPLFARLNAQRMPLLLGNVLQNAVQYSPPGTHIDITLASSVLDDGERWVDIVFRDRGPGLAPDDLEHATDAFYSKRKGGTGLGLAIASRAASDMGGRLTLANHAQGGALVTVSLREASMTEVFVDSQR